MTLLQVVSSLGKIDLINDSEIAQMSVVQYMDPQMLILFCKAYGSSVPDVFQFHCSTTAYRFFSSGSTVTKLCCQHKLMFTCVDCLVLLNPNKYYRCLPASFIFKQIF